MTSDMRQQPSVARFGFWAALATGLLTLVTFAIAIATPPLSGSLCRQDCISYPYLDIAERFPRDYYWMFPGLLATLAYTALMAALHARAAPDRRATAGFALGLALMAAFALLTDYYAQLAMIQPSVIAGEREGLALWSQYNPHGLFIALEELGYLLMSLSLAAMAPTLDRSSRLERVVRIVFTGGALVTLLVFAGFLWHLGHRRGYLFEIAVISIDWLVLISTSFVLVVVFRRELRGSDA